MLNYNPINESFEEGKRAFASQRYDDAVKSYTRALAALQTDLSAVIHGHRAAAYEKQSKHGLAAEDRRMATVDRNDPHSSRINTEDTPQTKSQCDILAAKYGQEDLTLKESKNQRLGQALPYEVLSHILSKLSSKDCTHLGTTCQFWYDVVFQKWPHVWDRVNPGKDFGTFNLTPSTRRYIKSIQGEQVRELHLKFSPSENRIHHAFVRDFLENGLGLIVEDSGDVLLDFMDRRWDGVESLTMHYCTESHFTRVSCFVKESLKTLTLIGSNKSGCDVNILHNAARNFPKLQTMTNDFGAMDYNSRYLGHYLEKAAQLCNFQITSFSIPSHLNEPIDQVFQKLPALKSLTVSSLYVKNYAALLNSVYQHCPALEELNYTYKETQKLSATHTRFSAATGNGIKTLIIQPLEPWWDNDANPIVSSMFQRAHKTLQTLRLYLDFLDDGRFSALDTLSQLGAPLVQTLVLNASKTCYIGPDTICNLISACPSLVTIKLSGTTFWTDKIFDVLAKSSKLRRVSIDILKVYFDEVRITTEGIRAFFERTRNISNFSFYCLDAKFLSVNDLTLGLTRGASLSTIRKLDFRIKRLTSNTLVRSLEYLKHSRVQILKIGMECPIGDKEIDAFANIPCLMDLIIYDYGYFIKEEHVCMLLNRWQHPQMLVVRIRGTEPEYYIKGYKADLATMRQAKDQITDPMIRYSIKSHNPSRAEPLRQHLLVDSTPSGSFINSPPSDSSAIVRT